MTLGNQLNCATLLTPPHSAWFYDMNNNDIIRRVRYILDLKDNQITKIFKHVDTVASEQQVNQWLKREEDEGFVPLTDELLIDFLDAIIIEKRGRKEGSDVRQKQHLDNNLILMKLKIAFHLKAEDALAIMELAQFKISKHEFSALFRKKDHKHYRACKNQMLRKFLKGLQVKYRGRPNQGASTKNKPVIPVQAEKSDRPKTLKLKRKPDSKSKDNFKSKDKSHYKTKTDKSENADSKPKSPGSKFNAKPSSKPASKPNTTAKSKSSKAASIWKVPKK